MKIIDYNCHLFAEEITYQLVQYGAQESFQLFHANTLVGSFIKVGDRCVQVSGSEVSDDMLADICKLL